MTPEAQRIAIAKACGWLNVEMYLPPTNDDFDPAYQAPAFPRGVRPSVMMWRELPDYLNDLNAMRSAVQSQPPQFRAEFQERLDNVALTRKCLVCDLTSEDWAHCFLAK